MHLYTCFLFSSNRFLVSVSVAVFGRTHFDLIEVPDILYSSLRQLLVGRYFRFLVKQPNIAAASCRIQQATHGCVVVVRMLPLQAQPSGNIVTVLKFFLLEHTICKSEDSNNSSPSCTPQSCGEKLASGHPEYVYGCLDDSEGSLLVELHSYNGDDSNASELSVTQMNTSSAELNGVDSQPCSVSVTHRAQESTPAALRNLCELFTPLPSKGIITSKSDFSPTITSTQDASSEIKLVTFPDNSSELLLSDKSMIDFQCTYHDELLSDLSIQHKILRELEADWIPTQSQVCSSSSEAHVARPSQVTSCFNSDAIPCTGRACLGYEISSSNETADAVVEAEILEDIVAEWVSTQSQRNIPQAHPPFTSDQLSSEITTLPAFTDSFSCPSEEIHPSNVFPLSETSQDYIQDGRCDKPSWQPSRYALALNSQLRTFEQLSSLSSPPILAVSEHNHDDVSNSTCSPDLFSAHATPSYLSSSSSSVQVTPILKSTHTPHRFALTAPSLSLHPNTRTRCQSPLQPIHLSFSSSTPANKSMQTPLTKKAAHTSVHILETISVPNKKISHCGEDQYVLATGIHTQDSCIRNERKQCHSRPISTSRKVINKPTVSSRCTGTENVCDSSSSSIALFATPQILHNSKSVNPEFSPDIL